MVRFGNGIDTSIDSLVIHANDLGDTVGFFYDRPIVSWDPQKTKERDAYDARMRLVNSRIYQELNPPQENNVPEQN